MINPDTTFWCLVALTAAVAAWGVMQVLLGLFASEKTVIEQRLRAERRWDAPVDPTASALVQKRVDPLPDLLRSAPFMQRLHGHVQLVMPGVGIQRFLALSLALGAVLFTAGYYLHSFLAGLLAGACATAIPFLIIAFKIHARQSLLTDQLMDALDFLARALRAGHSLSVGFQMIGEELPEPIATEFRRCHDQHSLGRPLDGAMLDMTTRVDSPDFAFFVTSVLIQRQTGGDLAQLLDNISGVVRNRIRLGQKVKALTSEGRFTGWLLTALPPVLFVVLYTLNPEYSGLLLFTAIGRTMVLSMAVLQVIGLLIMKKIVTIKV